MFVNIVRKPPANYNWLIDTDFETVCPHNTHVASIIETYKNRKINPSLQLAIYFMKYKNWEIINQRIMVESTYLRVTTPHLYKSVDFDCVKRHISKYKFIGKFNH